jgi:hypothetical protein
MIDQYALARMLKVQNITLIDNRSYIRVAGPRLLATAAAIVALSTPTVSLQALIK